MPTPDPLITRPWSDYSYNAQRAVIIQEISGSAIITGPAAIAAGGIFKGSFHPDDARLICDDPTAIPLSARNFWRVTYGYQPIGTSNDPNQLKEPPRYRWRIGLKSEPEDRDSTDDQNPILNSAGDPPDNLPPNDFPEGFLTITRFETAPFDFQDRWNYVGKVNVANMTLQGHSLLEGQCKCLGIAPTGEYTMLDKIIEVAYDFELSADGFDLEFLDQGHRSWYQNGRKNKRIISEIFHPPDSANGETVYTQISAPVLLNGMGQPLIDTLVTKRGQPLTQNPSDKPPSGAEVIKSKKPTPYGVIPVYLRYKRKKRIDFSALGL